MLDSIKKDNVIVAVNEFVKLAQKADDQRAIELINPLVEQYKLGLFRIVIVGEIKKGKSSFINALLGCTGLLPVSTDIATSTVYKIMYGNEKKYKVFFLPEDTDKPENLPAPLEIKEQQLKDYGTEDGNPGNKKRVDFIGIQMPNQLLKNGITIIDTPGLGGLFRKHRDITWRYIPNADAVFFVLDSVEAVASQAEMDCLDKLREKNPLIFFVQTKTDLVEESQWKSWRDRNLVIISEKLNIPSEKLIYFPLSSKWKSNADEDCSSEELDRSGYSALLYFLYNKLLLNKEQQIAKRVLSSMSVEAVGIHRKFSDQLQIAMAETKEDIESLEREYNKAKADFEQWKTSKLQSSLMEFQDDLNSLKRKTRDALLENLDASPSNIIISNLLDMTREGEIDPKQLNQEADYILSECIDRCSQIVFDIQGAYNDSVYLLMNELSANIGKSMSIKIGTPISGITKMHIENLKMNFSGFEEARNTMYGGMAGAAMGGGAVALLAMLFPPLAAAAGVAALIGAVVGGRKATESSTVRRKEEAISKLQQILCDAVRKAQAQALRQFDSISAEYEKCIRNSIRQATSEIENELSNNMRSLSEQKKQTREETKKKADKIRKILEDADAVIRNIERLAVSGTSKGQKV